MELKEEFTPRGFKAIRFNDLYDAKCNIQQSSWATRDSSWLGIEDILAAKVNGGRPDGWVTYVLPEDVFLTTRIHLDRELAKILVDVLNKFIETGEI
jgi:hypothetical protein